PQAPPARATPLGTSSASTSSEHLLPPGQSLVPEPPENSGSFSDLQLRLLLAGELPESWIPPAQILELRTRVRMRKTLIDQRTAWQQRLQAQLFHQGIPAGLRLRTQAGRDALTQAELSPAGRELVTLGLRMIDALDLELAPLDRELHAFARRQHGCRTLIADLYGVGPVSATAI